MKRTYLYIFILLLLGVIATMYALEPKTTLSEKETNFAVKNIKAIHTIYMADMSGKEIKLERKKGEWTLNNRLRPRPDAIELLLETIGNIAVARPVADAAHNNVVRNLAARHVKVEVYGARKFLLFFSLPSKRPIRTYYVGGSTLDNRGTFMLIEGADRPYVTYIPGFEGYLTPRYFLNEEEWRDRSIFRYAFDDIRSISIEYPNNPASSFEIKRSGKKKLELTALIEDESTRKEHAINVKALEQYFYFFEDIRAEAFENNYIRRDSVVNSNPHAIIRIIDNKGDENKVMLFLMGVTQRSKTQFDDRGRPMKYDVDRLYALMNNGKDFVIIQYYVFGKLLLGYYDFILEN